MNAFCFYYAHHSCASKRQAAPSAAVGHQLQRSNSNHHQQRGIALVMVLWLLVLMTVIASSHSRNIRTETRLAFNHVESGKARNLAEAGVYHAIMELLVADNKERWPVNGSIHHVRFDDGVAAISIRDTRGLVDINTAHGATLDTLLAGAGIEDEQQRQQLVDATLDWRDKDNLKHMYGAEDDDYRHAGLQWGARDDLFTSIEEFRYVLGMTNPLFEYLAPYLTVHSGETDINPDYAPQWLIDVFNLKRNISASAGQPAPGASSTLQISVLVTTTGGTTASLGAVVQLSAKKDEPYKVLSWRTPARSPAKEPSI